MANQLGSFLPDLSQATSHLRILLKKDTAYVWTAEMATQFQKAKDILTSKAIVKPYDPELKTSLLTDASKLHGLGYILLQWDNHGELRIVQCGSFALTSAQKNYAVIELEMLAIVRAIDKCRFYLQGADTFEVITDHKPLLGIMDKPINEIDNPRLSRFRQKISAFVFTISWKPGKYHFAADALSRYPVFSSQEDNEHYAVARLISCTDARLDEMAERAKSDPEYQSVITALQSEKLRKTVADPTHPISSLGPVWSELSITETEKGNLITHGQRIFPPKGERKNILAQLHSTHQGIVKTRLAAKEKYFWPGMNNDVLQTVENCAACHMFRPSPRAEPHQATIVHLTAPMQMWSSDFFEYGGKNYLVLIDGFSGYLMVDELLRTSSLDIFKLLDRYFNLFGYHEMLK
jgi:hypothetical protein